MRLWMCILLMMPCTAVLAQDKPPSADSVKASTEQLEKDWDKIKREYKKKFKEQMPIIEAKINELKNALDGGDPEKRKQINAKMKEMKELRDKVRQAFHEITVTSIVDLSAVQKHFKNAKDDTKD